MGRVRNLRASASPSPTTAGPGALLEEPGEMPQFGPKRFDKLYPDIIGLTMEGVALRGANDHAGLDSQLTSYVDKCNGSRSLQ